MIYFYYQSREDTHCNVSTSQALNTSAPIDTSEVIYYINRSSIKHIQLPPSYEQLIHGGPTYYSFPEVNNKKNEVNYVFIIMLPINK